MKMTLYKLVSKLNDMHKNANNGESVAMIHLFGVRYAQFIGKNNIATASQIIKASNLSDSYFAEINKGVKLSKYVVEK